MPEPIPVMTVTIQVDGGPTAPLSYDGGWMGGPIIPFSSIVVAEQAMTRRPGYLYDLLIQPGALLYAANQQQWPADLRPANRRRDQP
jgi:hypothetical protein